MSVVELEGGALARAGPRLRGRRLAGLLVCVAVAGSLLAAGAGSQDLLNPGGWPQVQRFFAAAAAPRLDGGFLALTADAALTTLAYAAAGTALSLVLGLAGGLAAARVSWGRLAPWVGVRALLAVPRGVHEVIWGLVLLAILGLQPLVAVLAIGLPFGAVTAKVFSELLDEAPRRPYEALRTAGATQPAAVLYAAVPLARADLLSYGFYRLECAIRAAAILGLVGAGGLGFQMALSFQSLHYDELWTFVYALVLLSGLADAWSSAVRRRRPGAARDRVATASALAALALVPASAWWLRLDPSTLSSGPVLDRARDVLAGALPPQVPAGGWVPLLRATGETLAMSILAGAFAFAGGLLFVLPAARLQLGRLGRLATLPSRAVLLLLRAVPPPVWALVVLFVLFPGVLPGAVALGLYNLGIVGRLLAETAENVDPGPREALAAAGAGRMATLLYAVLPAAIARFAAVGLYRWEVAVRETIVVGVVGAGGLGLLLHHQLVAFDYAAALTSVLAIVALTFAADLAGAAVRATLR